METSAKLESVVPIEGVINPIIVLSLFCRAVVLDSTDPLFGKSFSLNKF